MDIKHCFICHVKLTHENISRKDWMDGDPPPIRLDAFGNPWCRACSDLYDSLELDKPD
jgi:hypothetical protein